MVADIAIVGGGPSGLAFAGICEQQGLDYILYERSAKDTPPRGGALDIHVGSGQRALKEAGVFDEFKKYGRGGDSTIHRVFDHQGNQVYQWGVGRDAPEIDRHDLKNVLLGSIPEHKVRWRKELKSAVRDDEGKIMLEFADGEMAKGFKLVVGSDGVSSKVRSLVTAAVPQYFGVVFVSGHIDKHNPFYTTLRNKAGDGPMVVLGNEIMIWCQIAGSGAYRVELGFQRPSDFARTGPVDMADIEAWKTLMLTEEFFGHHNQFFQGMITAIEGPLRDWPLYEMPYESLDWKPSADVTLIGDAAHATTPFVGDGANCAMRDSAILVEKLKKFGFGVQAVAAYEEEMFGFARPMIQLSSMNGGLFFDKDSSKGLVKTTIIGTSDDY